MRRSRLFSFAVEVCMIVTIGASVVVRILDSNLFRSMDVRFKGQ
jgi:hypothetical protein